MRNYCRFKSKIVKIDVCFSSRCHASVREKKRRIQKERDKALNLQIVCLESNGSSAESSRSFEGHRQQCHLPLYFDRRTYYHSRCGQKRRWFIAQQYDEPVASHGYKFYDRELHASFFNAHRNNYLQHRGEPELRWQACLSSGNRSEDPEGTLGNQMSSETAFGCRKVD